MLVGQRSFAARLVASSHRVLARVGFVAGFLLTSCGPSLPTCAKDQETPDRSPAVYSQGRGFSSLAHSHNDYEHRHPLWDALDFRFRSVEADIYFDHGDLLVAHGGPPFKGSLAALYLDPLQTRVDERGTVFGDGEPFFLWVDIKDDRPALIDALHELLNRYPMLSVFTEHEIIRRPVTVVLTGSASQGDRFVETTPRRACRDGPYQPSDPPADTRWIFHSLKWSDYVGWGGAGNPSAEDDQRLRCLLFNARSKSRKVRFFATPTGKDFWRAALEYGFDFINTDDLGGLAGFLEAQAAASGNPGG